MAELTMEQLGDKIKTVVLPIIEDKVGAAVKAVVEENITKHMESRQKAFITPFMDALKDQKKEAPTEMEKGLKFARCVQASYTAKQDGLGRRGVVQVLKEWKFNEMADEVDAHIKALAATDAVAGGFLVPAQYSQEIVELLRNVSVVRRAGPTVIQMSTGTFRIPKITEGSTAYYIGENQPIPPSQPAFGQLTLSFKKLACLVPTSNDLLRYSSPGADAIIRDDMVREMADTENDAFLRGDGLGGTPRGLLNWVLADQLISANGTANLDNFVTDMGKLIIALLSRNIPMTRPVWIFAPRTWNYAMNLNTSGIFPFRDELKAGRFWGWPFFMSNAVPTNTTFGATTLTSEIYLVDMADVVLGESMNLTVDASQEAAYASGGTMISAFQNDQTVIRAISEHDLVMRRQESLAILQGAVYGK